MKAFRSSIRGFRIAGVESAVRILRCRFRLRRHAEISGRDEPPMQDQDKISPRDGTPEGLRDFLEKPYV
jgi:hypothetical protein